MRTVFPWQAGIPDKPRTHALCTEQKRAKARKGLRAPGSPMALCAEQTMGKSLGERKKG